MNIIGNFFFIKFESVLILFKLYENKNKYPMKKTASKCFITKPSDIITFCDEDEKWKEVHVHHNGILDAIMDAHELWFTSPIVFVGSNYNYVYRIIPIHETETYAVVYQICLRFDTKYKTYIFTNKRRVVIWF